MKPDLAPAARRANALRYLKMGAAFSVSYTLIRVLLELRGKSGKLSALLLEHGLTSCFVAIIVVAVLAARSQRAPRSLEGDSEVEFQSSGSHLGAQGILFLTARELLFEPDSKSGNVLSLPLDEVEGVEFTTKGLPIVSASTVLRVLHTEERNPEFTLPKELHSVWEQALSAWASGGLAEG